jgi:cbb3-type cytochrome oxidase maturation protein
MEIIFLLLTISICLALVFLISFIWASRSGQFDDTYGPSVRMLFDNEFDAPTNDSKNEKECK